MRMCRSTSYEFRGTNLKFRKPDLVPAQVQVQFIFSPPHGLGLRVFAFFAHTGRSLCGCTVLCMMPPRHTARLLNLSRLHARKLPYKSNFPHPYSKSRRPSRLSGFYCNGHEQPGLFVMNSYHLRRRRLPRQSRFSDGGGELPRQPRPAGSA